MQKNGKFLSTGGQIYGLLIGMQVKVMSMKKISFKCSFKYFEQCVSQNACFNKILGLAKPLTFIV